MNENVNNATAFGWLEQDISSVKTPKFFVVNGPISPKQSENLTNFEFPLPESYRNFLSQFGEAKLYFQQSGYELGIQATPKKVVAKNGEVLVCIGHYKYNQAYFKAAHLKPGQEPPVYEKSRGDFKKVAASFSAWLKKRSEQVRASIGTEKWEIILKGPKGFSLKEKKIFQAKDKYTCRLLEIDADGQAVFEVFNGSENILPFYTIGIRDKKGGYSGKAYLPISDIAPGRTGLVKTDSYKQYISQDRLEIFNFPSPKPEERKEFWELQELVPPADVSKAVK